MACLPKNQTYLKRSAEMAPTETPMPMDAKLAFNSVVKVSRYVEPVTEAPINWLVVLNSAIDTASFRSDSPKTTAYNRWFISISLKTTNDATGSVAEIRDPKAKDSAQPR